MERETGETTARMPAGKFAFVVVVLGLGAATCSYLAFCGGQNWQRDAVMAIGLWQVLGLLVIDHLYCYKLRRSSRMMVAGVYGMGVGIVLGVAVTVLQVGDISAAVLVVFVGGFLVLFGVWTRFRE